MRTRLLRLARRLTRPLHRALAQSLENRPSPVRTSRLMARAPIRLRARAPVSRLALWSIPQVCTFSTATQHYKGVVATGVSSDRKAKNFHQILGVSPTASRDAIRSAYHKRLFETHPDHGGSPEAFLEVREAYQALVFPDDTVLRDFAEAVWANDMKRVDSLWLALVRRMQQTQTLRFDGLYFDAILYACTDDSHYEQITRIMHEAQGFDLFLDEDSRDTAYDSLLWHLKEGNRMRKADIHLLFDCLDHMHSKGLHVPQNGWYSMHYWQG